LGFIDRLAAFTEQIPHRIADGYNPALADQGTRLTRKHRTISRHNQKNHQRNRYESIHCPFPLDADTIMSAL
jgi:hypothetical protein